MEKKSKFKGSTSDGSEAETSGVTQCRPLCTRTAAQSLRDHTLLFLQDPCLLRLPGLMASSKGRKTNGKSLVRLCLIWHQVPAAAPAGQIATGARATEPPEFCQQDGWCAARGKDEEDQDPSQRLLDSSRGAQCPGGTAEPFPQRYPGGTEQKHAEARYPAEGFLRDSLRKACCVDVDVEGLFGKEGFWFLRLEEPS